MTNLVIELGVILIILLGWPFAAAEYVGGIVMVILIALIFRLTFTRRLVDEDQRNANRSLVRRIERHAAMDMSVTGGSLGLSLVTGRGFSAISHYFVMHCSRGGPTPPWAF